jgi:hypothetical protein
MSKNIINGFENIIKLLDNNYIKYGLLISAIIILNNLFNRNIKEKFTSNNIWKLWVDFWFPWLKPTPTPIISPVGPTPTPIPTISPVGPTPTPIPIISAVGPIPTPTPTPTPIISPVGPTPTPTPTPIINPTSLWKQIPGSLIDISASGNGYIWGVNKNNSIFKCKKPCSGKWIQSDGSLSKVSGDQNNIWGVSSVNNIYKRPIDGSDKWKQIPGSLIDISASGNEYIWGINKNNSIFKCKKPCDNGNWVQENGSLQQISSDQLNIWGINNSNNIFKKSY